ncbi:MAG: sugar transferase [Deinococcales bacterium]|nr:sugar transferase [Deinococcales bacterium]
MSPLVPSRTFEDRLRRLLDALVSGVGLLLLSPLLLGAALAVRLSSPGPVLFRQERVGLGGRPFEILKFRTMRVDADRDGLQLTVGDDPRITSVGRFLRAWKLDELPQLLNVLKGDMALVGPRPEVPRYVALYTPEQRRVLTVRPGITDPASVAFRSESELLAGHPQPERLYVEAIMPEKLRLNLAYLERRTLLTDLGIVIDTLRAVARPQERAAMSEARPDPEGNA